MAALLATLLFAAVSVPALTDDNLSRSLALNRELSARNGIRVLEIPVEIGECWGKISSCPDVELVVTYATGGESKGTHVNVGWLVPLILRGVVDLPMRTWFNLGDNAG